MKIDRPIPDCQPELDVNGYAVEGRPWVLVAEDDNEMRRLLVETLNQDGYEVLTAGSGLELFDRLREAKEDSDLPKLIVSDIRMPGLSGLQVLRTVQKWGMAIPVILITAFPDEETLSEAEQYGAAAILSKPFEMDDLRTAVLYLYSRPDRAKSMNQPT